MKLLSNILYFCILKPWLWLSFQLFYQKIDIFNRKNKIPSGPLLLVSNHPNTLMDVVLSGIFTPRKVHFLANAGLFRTAFNRWFFTLFFSIPIERRQDSGRRKVNNHGSFSRCIAFLQKGGCLYIAPEGSSWVERHLRPLKTGTARIALATEAAGNFSSGLQILPLGISYSNQQAFQSRATLSFGKPISLLQYKDLAEEHQRRAAQQLTEEIRTQLEAEMIHTTDPYEDDLLRFLEPELATKLKNPYERFRQTQQAATALARFRAQDEPAFKQLHRQWRNYEALLDRHGLKMGDLTVVALKAADWLFLILGFPLFLYGILNHLPLYQLIHWINRRFNSDPTYDSTYKFLSLWLGMPLFYSLQTFAISVLATNPWLPWVYFAGLFPAGLFANYYRQRSRGLLRQVRVRRLGPQDKITLLEQHQQLALALEAKLTLTQNT